MIFLRSTKIGTCTSAKSFGAVIIIVHDLSGFPVSGSFHSSHNPATVSASEPSRPVKYHGCLPFGQRLHKTLRVDHGGARPNYQSRPDHGFGW
jgi:hypothetical protein